MRTLKAKSFARAQRKARIADAELRQTIKEVEKGRCDDLGGGVFKKRLNRNEHRAIILSKAGEHWVYAYLFAKKDRANIEDDELRAFRLLAGSYARMNAEQIEVLLAAGDLVEIDDG